MRPYLDRQAGTGRSGIAGAQEFQRVWSAYPRLSPNGAWQWWFTRADRRVSCYYFYLWLRHEVARCEWLREGGWLMPKT
jgi:hypothetical protein